LTASRSNLFLDLDGTILSTKERCARVFCDLLGIPPKSFIDDYISKREQGESNSEIIRNGNFSQTSSTGEFSSKWMNAIEAPEYLKYDALLDGVKPWLEAQKADFDLHVCTNRQNGMRTLAQLRRLGILGYFDEVLVTHQVMSKSNLIRSTVPSVTSDDWMIGDSIEDIREGKKIKLQTCAVLTGFAGVSTLSRERPDRIVRSLDYLSFANS